MRIEADNPEAYVEQLPEERKGAISRLRTVILENLPNGFEESMNYGMIGYVVPHSLYPAGYHVNPDQPLPFMSIASQKNFIGLYHMGIYVDPDLMGWFKKEYSDRCTNRLDMGKSCIRFRNIDKIPYLLIGELATKLSPREWVSLYESRINRS